MPLNNRLLNASKHCYNKIVKFLIVKENAKDNDGYKPIHAAAYSGDIETVKLLIKKGADVNAKDHDGNTALHWAALNGHIEVVIFLIKMGADAHAIGKCGYKPIHFATINKHADVVKFLSNQCTNKVDAKGNELFSIIKYDKVDMFTEKYGKLFRYGNQNILNDVVPHCILKIQLLTKVFEENTKRSGDISKGICMSFSNLVGFLKFNSKEDFNELYGLMNFNLAELNEENFKKFLENKLENDKIKAVFELMQIIVEYSPILESGNINHERLPQKTLIRYVSDDCYDMQSHQIIINKSMVSNTLKELKNGDNILYAVQSIFQGKRGHVMSITKNCDGQYMFFDSNKPHVLKLSSEEQVCYIIELVANMYCENSRCFPGIEIINSTETIKEVMEHCKHEKEDKPSSFIWDIREEALKQKIIKEVYF